MKKLTYTLEDSIVLLKWVCGVLTVFVLITMLTLILNLMSLGKDNNTYLRTEACILSVPLATRTADYISNCYLQAEKTNGTNVDHFGSK